MNFKAYGDWLKSAMEAGAETSRHVVGLVEKAEQLIANPPKLVLNAEASGPSWADFAAGGKVTVEVHPPDKAPAKKFRATFDEHGLKLEEVSDA
jgi:hypothetical protein